VNPGRDLEQLLVSNETSPVLLPALRLDLIQAFVVLAAELHVTRASELLFLSQSGLSRRIKALEAVLGTRLLHRTTRQVHLTPEGERLLPYARQILLVALSYHRETPDQR
jgi:DNA-binding transcriptional LysR family regulator